MMKTAILALLTAMTALAGETQFEISFPQSVHAGAITGRVYIMITKDPTHEPRLEVRRVGVPFFGRDVEKLARAKVR